MIRSVICDLSPKQLGHCQCHEHLFIEKGPSYFINPTLCIDDYDKSEAELFTYREAGGNAIVDAQPMYFGRMAAALCRASKITKVHIIAVTGFHKLIFCEGNAFPVTASEDEIANFFISEVKNGMMSETGSILNNRAGLIKVAVDTGGIHADKRYEILFHASARASEETGAAILVHMETGVDAFEVIRFFEENSIPAHRLILCHLDRTHHDAIYHHEVLSTNVFLNYDSINRPKYVSLEQEIRLILSMLEAGFGNRLMLSLDTTRARLAAYGAEMGLSYILTSFLPMLRAHGINDDIISVMMIQNARKVLQLIPF